MSCTGLLFLEIIQWMHQEANIVSMAQQTLGHFGKIAAWVLYLFLFYSLNIAYIVELGKIVVGFIDGRKADWMGPVIFLILFAPCILIPTALAGKVNIGLMIGLVLSYLGFIILGSSYVNLKHLIFKDWSASLKALPIAFTSFAYQGMVPTLVTYLDYDIKKARKTILIGSFIPFVVYAIWQSLIMGIVPVRQEKVLLRMFTEGLSGLKGGLSTENYLAITETSRATATRDLTDLVQKRALIKTGELRHTRYWLNLPTKKP